MCNFAVVIHAPINQTPAQHVKNDSRKRGHLSRSGGLSYGSTYMGPIGIIMMPTFDIRRYSELPFSSTLNGSCTNVCPVKINIHEQIYAWREVMEEEHQINLVKKSAMVSWQAKS